MEYEHLDAEFDTPEE